MPGLKLALQKLTVVEVAPAVPIIELPAGWEKGNFLQLIELATQHMPEHRAWPMFS